jgi:hypothetical protein
METSSSAPAESGLYRRIAHPLHTVLVLALMGLLAWRGAMRADHLRALVNPDRVALYTRTILFQWLMLAVVAAGVRLNGSPLATVLGDRWRSVREVLRDIGIGVVFSVLSTLVISMVSGHGHSNGPDPAVQFLLPHGRTEMMLWVALSVTAGICEEALYRGYVQRQMTALTKNVAVGILISAIAFGLGHAYQGWRLAAPIALGGALLGMLAHWRRSVRPGMIAHAGTDALAPVLMGMMKS